MRVQIKQTNKRKKKDQAVLHYFESTFESLLLDSEHLVSKHFPLLLKRNKIHRQIPCLWQCSWTEVQNSNILCIHCRGQEAEITQFLNPKPKVEMGEMKVQGRNSFWCWYTAIGRPQAYKPASLFQNIDELWSQPSAQAQSWTLYG